MRWVLAGLPLCVIGQTILLPPLSLGGIRPDLFLVLLFLVSRRLSPEAATGTGFLIGLCQDALSGAPLGLHAFSDSLLGFLTARLGHDIHTEKPLALFLILAGGTVTARAIALALLAFFFGPQPLLPILVRGIAPEALYTAMVGMVVLWVTQRGSTPVTAG